MAVYVDKSRNRFGRLVMCHMVADTVEELHSMADRLYLKPEWFQPKSHPHYDICQAKRRQAIKLGAIEVDRRQLVEIMVRYRNNAHQT